MKSSPPKRCISDFTPGVSAKKRRIAGLESDDEQPVNTEQSRPTKPSWKQWLNDSDDEEQAGNANNLPEGDTESPVAQMQDSEEEADKVTVEQEAQPRHSGEQQQAVDTEEQDAGVSGVSSLSSSTPASPRVDTGREERAGSGSGSQSDSFMHDSDDATGSRVGGGGDGRDPSDGEEEEFAEDATIPSTMPIDWVLFWNVTRANVSQGVFTPPAECQYMLADETGLLHPYVFFEEMTAFQFPESISRFIEGITEIQHVINTQNLDIGAWTFPDVEGIEITGAKIGHCQAQCAIYGNRTSFIRGYCEIVTVEKTQSYPSGENSEPERERTNFCVLTVIAPVSFNLRKALMDVITDNIHVTRGRQKSKRTEDSTKTSNGVLAKINAWKSRVQRYDGMKDIAAIQDNRGGMGEFADHPFMALMSLPAAMRQMLRMASRKFNVPL
eukprot:1252855-Rhodomonas_salina.1